jgi:putative NADPH-quinone reductase
MKHKKITILLGHPDKETLCGYFADQYEKGAKEGGHEVRRINISDMQFDPILHKGYKVIQEMEPDLKKLEEDIQWCDHFVLIYPTWWSAMPALLKGLFDRMWMPGFAFHFHKRGSLWDRMLKGRTARVFTTSDSRPIFLRLMFGDNTNEIERAILWFAGFRVRVKKIGPTKHITPERAQEFGAMLFAYGKKAK